MLNRVIVNTTDTGFRLTTRLGFPIGPRMDSGGDCPPMTDMFATKLEADRAALSWNTYLLSIAKKRAASAKIRGERS
jgi:hypothetical protein